MQTRCCLSHRKTGCRKRKLPCLPRPRGSPAPHSPARCRYPGCRGNEAGQSCTRSGIARRRYPPYILVFPTDNARSGFPVPLPESILSQKSPPLHIFPRRNQAVIVFRRQCADMTDTEHRVGKRAAVRADPDAVFILQNLKNPMR